VTYKEKRTEWVACAVFSLSVHSWIQRARNL